MDGLPVTTVARTLVDLAALLTEHQLERAVEQAEHLQLFDLAALERTLDRSAGRRGVGHLRRAVQHWTAGTPTRSELETRFLALCRRARVPLPVVNSDRLGREVDFAWPDLRLIVEVDGYATHRSRRAFSRDRRRDREARQALWRIERFTWDDVALRPTTTVGEIASIVTAQRELVATQPAVV
jgi:very-short-patch-repair endonuclease